MKYVKFLSVIAALILMHVPGYGQQVKVPQMPQDISLVQASKGKCVSLDSVPQKKRTVLPVYFRPVVPVARQRRVPQMEAVARGDSLAGKGVRGFGVPRVVFPKKQGAAVN